MKKIVSGCILAMFLSLSVLPIQSISASTPPASTTETPSPPVSPQAKALLMRLDEIKAMDISVLKPSEKRELRKEVRSIKQQLKQMGGYVYLSVGAVVLIVLLLIILL
jgi:biopolymer transport protein ExbD